MYIMQYFNIAAMGRVISRIAVIAFAVVICVSVNRADCAPVTVGIAETCRQISNKVVTADADVAARFSEAGAVAFVIPRMLDEAAIARMVARIDALVLSGGEDVAPARYGEKPEPKLEKVNSARDAFEIALLDAAARRGIPVIGFCRGCQLINVYHGGSLHQDIGGAVRDVTVHRDAKIPRSYVRHAVEAAGGSLLERLAGGKFEVNSWHHQAAKKVAPGFRVTARSADGIVEAIESERVFGVQFHPERIVAPSDTEFSRRFFAGLTRWIESFGKRGCR